MSRQMWSLRRWLMGDASDRQRYLEMHDRFRDAWVFGALIGGVTVLAAATYGWWLVVLPVFATLVMGAGFKAHGSVRDPELVGMATFLLLELDLAVTVLFTGGGMSPLLGLMVVPVFSQAVAFRPPVTAMWVTLSAVLALVVVAVGARLPQGPRPSSLLSLASFLALLGSLALAAHFLASSDVHSRDEAAQDTLTGLLNRKALRSRFPAIADRLRESGQPVTLLMVDADHFKAVNDAHGHQRGDIVLQQLAHRLIAQVRPQDLVFRVGGEEFVVLLPGLAAEAAHEVAVRLNAAVAAQPIAGLPVTVSVGLAAASATDLDFDRMMAAADAALYQAKREGRDCVRRAA